MVQIALITLFLVPAMALRLSGAPEKRSPASLISAPDFHDWGFTKPRSSLWYLPKEERFLADGVEPELPTKHDVACVGGRDNFELVGGWPVCHSNTRREKCVIYSFGIGGDLDYEGFQAGQGCEVHAFDPTVQLKQTHETLTGKFGVDGSEADPTKGRYSNVNFHYLGATGEKEHPDNLQHMGDSTDFGKEERSSSYGAVDQTVLKSIPEIMKSLGHDHIDILKMDCEGCEWGVFLDLSPEFLKDKVGDILMETHWCKNEMIPTAEAYQTLFKKIFATRKLQSRHENAHSSPTSPELLKMGVPDNVCTLEYAFIKTPTP